MERLLGLVSVEHVEHERHVRVVRTTKQLRRDHVRAERPISEQRAEELSRVQDGDCAVDASQEVPRDTLLALILLLLQQLRALPLA